MATKDFFQQLLSEELARRCERNARYSVRAFAKALGIDAGALSRILSGQRIPSMGVAQRILASLDLSPADQHRFTDSLRLAQRARGLQRLSPAFRATPTKPSEVGHQLFRIVSDWYHYAILELTFLKGFSSEPRWIAQQLGIGVTEAKLAVERLREVGLLVERNGHLVKSNDRITTSDKHVTSAALKRHQRQVLEKAIESLENDPIERRSMSSMTIAIDPKLLPAAKRMIEDFTQALSDLLESQGHKQVYNLGIALYPLQKESV